MFTDIAGYTALTQRDEALSMKLLEEHRALVRPFFPKHGGREVKTIGDAFLVEFGSALEAVRCAYDIQQSLHELNLDRSADRKVELRVGIHLGDVIHSQRDVYGDAVNVASRIEPLAAAGGVCISEQVHDQVRNKLEFPMVSLGRRELKNVAEAVEVFRVVLPWEKQANAGAGLDRNRIAVLPFANMSPDASDLYFADGMTEELITSLSKIRELSVIARTSVMKYRSSDKGALEIGKELNAGTLIEGSVRKAGSRARISVQLIDTQTEDHLWAQNYDRQLDDIFEVQTDIAETVAKELKVQLVEADRRRLEGKPTASTDAFLLYLMGQYYMHERTRDGIQKAIDYFNEAVEKDPNFARAYVGLSDAYTVQENWGYLSPMEASSKYKEFTVKALELDDSLPEAHSSFATILQCHQFDLAGAEKEFERAIELNPNYATARQWYANGLLGPQGRYQEAILQLAEAKRLDPLSPMISVNLGDQLLLSGRIEDAKQEYESIIDTAPDFAYAYTRLGLAYLRELHYEEGILQIQRSIELDGGQARANPEKIAYLIYAYMIAGRKGDAESLFSELLHRSKREYISNVNLAMADAAAGRDSEALDFLEKAAAERSNQLMENADEPIFEHLRQDERFQKLLRTIGMVSQ